MARTAEKAESLASESQSMSDALERVLAVADDKGTVSTRSSASDIDWLSEASDSAFSAVRAIDTYFSARLL